MARSDNDVAKSLQLYMRDLSASRPLSVMEERDLARLMKEGDQEARGRLISANLRFVVAVARWYQSKSLPLGDIISAGNLGLVVAAEKFDPNRGIKFISYAVWWIRHSIQDALAEHSCALRLPANRADLLRRSAHYTDSHQQQHNSSPSDEEVAEKLDIPLSLLLDTQTLAKKPLSLDATICDDGGPLQEYLADENQEPPDAKLMRDSLATEIEDVLGTLNERERKVLKLYYGLNGVPAKTLEDVGKVLGVTRERVRQIKVSALNRLRGFTSVQKLLPYAEDA